MNVDRAQQSLLLERTPDYPEELTLAVTDQSLSLASSSRLPVSSCLNAV
jgi:hypothetical protein